MKSPQTFWRVGFLLPLVLVLVSHKSTAQPSLLKMSIFCQGFGTTLNGIPDPSLSYGIRMGTEWIYGKKGSSSLGQDVNIGMYWHKKMQTSWFVSTAPTYILQLENGLLAQFSLGAGKSINSMAQSGFVDKGDGNFESTSHAIYCPWLLTSSISIGYNLAKISSVNLTVFAETQTTAELVQNQYTSIFPHHMFHLGARLPLSAN